MRLTTAVLAMALLAAPALAESGLIKKESPHDVKTTLDRLESAVKEGGASVVSRVDHASMAEGADMELRPTSLIIFGNPKMGTPLMQASQTIGVDLPLKAAAYEDADGQVHLIYHDPTWLAEQHGIPADNEAVKKVSDAMQKLTDKAVAEE